MNGQPERFCENCKHYYYNQLHKGNLCHSPQQFTKVRATVKDFYCPFHDYTNTFKLL